jgi:hypothetical protein
MSDLVQAVERAILDNMSTQLREKPRIDYPEVAQAAIAAYKKHEEQECAARWGNRWREKLAHAVASLDRDTTDEERAGAGGMK